MKQYTRITEEERRLIESGIKSRISIREIAKNIGRPPKTLSKEIQRNGGYLGYHSAQAHFNRNRSNRANYSKIRSNASMEQYIRNNLGIWTPEIIAYKWNNNNLSKISHESIYVWIYKQQDSLYLKLPRQKKERGLKPQRSKSKIPNRVSIHVRPDNINDRSEVGHYEGDLMFQKGNQSQNICSIVERKSRKIMLIKNTSKRSDVVVEGIKFANKKSKHPIASMTLDNGNEFANHAELGIDIYFCDPGSPWQKGAIENVNGILRRYIDYKLDINNIDQQMLDSVADTINNRPRKILGFLSANEMFEKLYSEKLKSVTF
jgi:transposase, IS30 family